MLSRLPASGIFLFRVNISYPLLKHLHMLEPEYSRIFATEFSNTINNPLKNIQE